MLNSMRDDRFPFVVIGVVYLLFLLDNILLTVVVPIIPDYLFSHNLNVTSHVNDFYAPRSLSPLQRQFETLDKDNGPLGALLASKAFVQLAFTPVVGYLIEIVGYNVPLLLGSCNMFLAAILFAYGRSYGVLVVARALHGSSSAAVSVSGMCLLAKLIPSDMRSKVMPLAFGGLAVGVLIGYPFGGAAYQLIGKTAPFLLIAVFIGMTIILQIIFFKKEDVTANRSTTCSDWLRLLRNRQTLISTIAICISTSAMSILEPCVPIWLLGHLNPPPSRWQLGAVFIPDSVGYFLGSHFAGLLPVDAWRTALISLLLVGLSCCAVPLATGLSELAVPHFGLGLGVGALDAVLVPMLANLVDSQQGDRHYGPVYAIQQAAVSLAYAFGPLLGGEAVHAIGFPWLMRLIGLLNVMYCPLLLELEKDKMPLLHEDTLPTYSSLDNSNSFDNAEWN